MRKTAKVSILLIAAFLSFNAASCSNRIPRSKKAIKKVAYRYLDAMANYRIDGAVPYCTTETQQGVLETGRTLVSAIDSNYIKSDTPATITIGDIEITSDTTAIAHFHKSTPLKEHNGQVNLVKRDGKWKVHIVQAKKNDTKDGTQNNKQETPKEPDIIQGNVNGQEIFGFPPKLEK